MLQFQILSIADEGMCGNQATIASRLGIDRTVMTYRVDDLEKDGLVTRRPDPADRRARQVVPCAKGKKVLRASSARIGDMERDVLGGLSDDEARVFRSLLARVAADAPADHSACAGPPPVCCARRHLASSGVKRSGPSLCTCRSGSAFASVSGASASLGP